MTAVLQGLAASPFIWFLLAVTAGALIADWMGRTR